MSGDHFCSPEELWVKLGVADDRDREHVALIQKARAALVAAGWPRDSEASWVKVLSDGTLDIRMDRPEFKTLASLRGLPVSVLDITHSSITDLSPVAGMPLRRLLIAHTHIADLSPLATCRQLEVLSCYDNGVRDLSPLAGLPLTVLSAGGNSFSSIAPLAGMPLKELRIDRTAVSDLSPLLACPTLEWLMIPAGARGVGQLRALKKLVRFSTHYDAKIEGSSYDRGGPAQTAEEFWQEFDAQQAAGRK